MPEKTKKHPCGACSENVTSATKSLMCTVCDLWFHYDCIEGMTKQLFDCCDLAYSTLGVSSFFCKSCKKATAKLNGVIKDLRNEVEKLSKRVEKLEAGRDVVIQQVKGVEAESVKMKEVLQGVEQEVVSGMVKAKEEVKKEMKVEMKRREDRNQRIAVYGIAESEEQDEKKKCEEDQTKVKEMIVQIGVEVIGDVVVQYRAGRPREGEEAKPRPVIVSFEDNESRARIMRNARNLSRKDGWKRVFVAPDLTFEQREEARRQEKELREEAQKKTDDAKNEGRAVRYVVIGQRGSRHVIEVQERERERE